MKKNIVIHLQTKSDPSGVVKMSGYMKGLGEIAGKVGEAFGGATTYLGQFVKNLAFGGIWQAGAAALGYLVKKVVEFATEAERAEKKAAEAARKANDERVKAVNEYAAALDKVAKAREASVSSGLKLLHDEIDATRTLTKATLELERAEARKRGDAGRVAAIDREMDAADADADRAKLLSEIDAARSRQRNARSEYRKAEAGLGEARAAVLLADESRKRAVRRARAEGEKEAEDWMGFATDGARRAAGDRAARKFYGTDEYKGLSDTLKQTKAGVAQFKERLRDAERAEQAAAAAERNLRNRLAALDARQEAKRVNAEADAAEKAAQARAAADEKAAQAAAAAEKKAAQDAARERERLDRELHQRRMADLRAEIAEQSKAAAPLRAAAAAARGEFARAFAMFRDPKRAADEIGEEKAYAADLDRLHAEAGRYGGKWRIDELARLMAAGDADGQTAALAEWRKSARFSPQVEAMVRASAAERAKTTAEDELRKIEANTAGLAEKLDELIGMKGGE